MNRIKSRFDLTGKTAIITGASKGIGESIARGFAEFGANVVVSSRKQAAVDEVAESFRKDGLSAIGVECHVAKSDQQKHLIDKTMEAFWSNRYIGSIMPVRIHTSDRSIRCLWIYTKRPWTSIWDRVLL